jgi:SAM-dependent methyltransferase
VIPGARHRLRVGLGQLARLLLPDPAVARLRKLDEWFTLRTFLREGRRPWAPGYLAWRDRFIAQGLSDPQLLERFRRGTALPPGFGFGLDERCVEYGWLAAWLPPGPGRLLDAGSTLNHGYVLDHPALRLKTLDILTLAPEPDCFWQRGVSYLYRDLRELPLRDDYYDLVACISTLEHVGCDNRHFTGQADGREDRPLDHLQAMRELRRVLRPGGTLFLTVPFGRYQHFGTFQQFDLARLEQAIAGFGPTTEAHVAFYRYTVAGWAPAEASACAECEFVSWWRRPPDRWPQPPPLEPDHAAAARAIACVRLVKAGDDQAGDSVGPACYSRPRLA